MLFDAVPAPCVEDLSLRSELPDLLRVVLGAAAGRGAGFARCAANESVPGAFELADELELFEPELFVESVKGGRISNATCHQSIGPIARGALVGLNLLSPVDGARFFSLEALDHLTDCFGALGGALPDLHLAVP